MSGSFAAAAGSAAAHRSGLPRVRTPVSAQGGRTAAPSAVRPVTRHRHVAGCPAVRSTNYHDTFIEVAENSRAIRGEVPPATSGRPTVAGLQYALVAGAPYA